MSDGSTSLAHRPLLDGVRGVLMSVVVGYHLGGPYALPGGWVAMDLFFLLSGYLITTLLLKEHERSGRVAFATFYRRRIRRLAPSLLVVLAAVFAAVRIGGWSADFPDLRADGLSALLYYANWHFIWSQQSYFASFGQSPLRHTWSLAIEEQFYLVWPVLLVAAMVLLRRRLIALGLLLGAGIVASAWWMRHLVLGGADLSRAYYGTDTRAQGLLAGALLAVVLWGDRWDTARARTVGSVVGILGTVALAVMMVRFDDGSTAVYTRFGFVLICAACAALVFGALRATGGPLHWLYGNPLSRHLGHISYVAYLWHWPVIVLVSAPRFALEAGPARLIQLLLSLALAELTHFLVEDPIHRGRVSFRFGGAALGAAAATVLLLVVTLPGSSRPPAPPPSGRRSTGDATAAERVLLVGDSTAWVASYEAPDDLPFRLDAVFRARCDIIGSVVFTGDTPNAEVPECATWPQDWARAASSRPDVVIVSVGLRQLFDLDVDGRRVPVGSPEWERMYRAAVDRGVGALRSGTDGRILWLDVPCFRWEAAGSAGEEKDPRRVAIVNRVLADQLAKHPGVEPVPYRDWVCPGGVLDRDLRPDGTHLDEEGVTELWRRILVPRIQDATHPRGGGD